MRAYLRENGGRIIHERVETAELGDGHQSTSRQQSPEVGRDDIELLQDPPLRLSGVQLLGLLDVVGDQLDLVLHLLFGAVGEDLPDDILGLCLSAVEDELSGRLGTKHEQDAEDKGGDGATTDHVSPASADRGETGSDSVADELASGDRHVVEANHAASVLGRRDLCNVKGHNHGRRADAKTNDETADYHLCEGERRSLENGANGKEHTTDINGNLASISVGGGTGKDGTEKGTARCDRCDEFLVLIGKGGVEVIANV